MQNEFIIVTDDSCDMPPEFYKENNIPLLRLHFIIDGETFNGEQMSITDFYVKLRSGKMPTTSQVNVEQALKVIEPLLKDGKDILYIGFSSGLSGTVQSVATAASELREKYPERTIRVIDTLCASMGEGLILYKVVEMRDSGRSLDEIAGWVEDNKLSVAHFVAAEDLMHLHRGGRVTKTSAVLGSVLGIKPVIHVNNEGKLISIGKVRGRKQVLEHIADLAMKAMGEKRGDIFTISHADALDDAKFVAELVKEKSGIENYLIHFIGPVIGAHAGPGTIALFVMAENRGG
jgi:DegV family protein with EDD domain